jgi:hypothetical protein
MSNRKHYGILGSGDVNPKIVVDGLLDVNSEDTVFLVHARRKPQGAVETVYDFMADNEAKFVAYTRVDDNAPSAFLKLANGVNTIDDPAKVMIETLSKNKGTLLLLWDEANPEASEKLAIMAADAGVPIKDLSDGLAPIVVEGSEHVEVQQEPVQVEEETTEVKNMSVFSRDELLNMSINVLRRQAKALGLETGRMTKEAMVALILGEELVNDDPIIASDIAVEDFSKYALTGCLVFHYNNEMKTIPLEPEVVASLLGWA